MDKKRIIKNEIGSSLKEFGYEFVELPGWDGFYFFRKKISENTYSFVEISLMPWLPSPEGSMIKSTSQSFRVSLWRNNDSVPKLGFGDKESKDWLNLPLSYLLWDVFKNKKYKKAYHVWEFQNQEELKTQLQDALEVILEYGIPWVEDPNSINPFPS